MDSYGNEWNHFNCTRYDGSERGIGVVFMVINGTIAMSHGHGGCPAVLGHNLLPSRLVATNDLRFTEHNGKYLIRKTNGTT